MQLISKFNKGFRFLLCAIDIFTKYAWALPLKYKKGVTITNAFQKVLDGSNRKPNKIWVDKGSGFYSSFSKRMVKRYGNVFDIKRRKICCCWKIYQNVKD